MAAAAHARFMDDCAGWMPSYTNQGASVDQKRLYSQCVQALYPEPADTSEVIWMKVAVVATILFTIGGIWWGIRQVNWRERDWTDRFMLPSLGAMMGVCVGPLLVGAVWGLIHGLKYVFT
jgi:hypothetical protein